MTTTNTNNIATLNLVDANGATVTFIYNKPTHDATIDYGMSRIDWSANKDFFGDLASIDMDVNLFDGDEAFTPDGNTPFYCIENPDGLESLIGQETLDKGLAWIKKTHNATLYEEDKERARQEAVEWSSEFANHAYSWGDLADWADHFAKLGKSDKW